MSMLFAIAAERCCGTREGDGAVYIESAHCPPGAPNCVPLSHFMIDPAVPVDVKALGITHLGVRFVPAPHPEIDPETWDGTDAKVLDDPAQTVWHIFDWVGSEYTILDYWMEAVFLGVSRKLSRESEFKKISEHSRLVLLHSHAAITNYQELWTAERPPLRACPKCNPAHARLAHGAFGSAPEDGEDPQCNHFWWHDVDPKRLGELDKVQAPADDPLGWRTVSRRLPAGMRYTCWLRPEGWTPQYTDDPAAFLSIPIGRLAVTAGVGAEESYDSASASGVRVDIVPN